MSSKKSKKKVKEINLEVKHEIPDEIKILYGRFYVFSIIYLLFFGLVYPILLFDIVTELSSVILFVLLGLFYIYMIVDVIRHKKTYSSIWFIFLIILVVLAFSFSIVKFFI